MKSFKIMAALGLCAAIATGTASAQDKSKQGVWDIHKQKPTTTTQAPATTQPQQPGVLDHGRVPARRPVVHHTAPTNRPPGWDHGRKTGWGDCNVPPGQAKKAGCTPAHHRDHRWAERRAAERRAAERREAHRRVERHEERREAHREAERRERRHERVEVAKRGHR